ncbi:nucleotidyltransferase domain-containing protein [Rhodothermus marinus]|uniref:nucleotidyltransferase domain-containing protein n=1 Tax=Rhodothermus marinus TaxID=29549 RepID=UPI0023428B25
MEATLDQIRTAIREVFQEHGLEPDQILLFGSRARGTAGPYSDWDVLIVTLEALTVPQKNAAQSGDTPTAGRRATGCRCTDLFSERGSPA